MVRSWVLEIGKRLRITNYQLPYAARRDAVLSPKSIITLHFFIFLTAITAISVKHFGVP